MNAVRQARLLGQQIWLDALSLRDDGGEHRSLDDIGIAGQTTNPAIFLQALQNDPGRKSRNQALKAQGSDLKSRYESIICGDVRDACDIFAAEYRRSEGDAGFVSIEVDPELSDDAEATITQALRLWQHIDRPNLMIKIPANEAGMTAAEELIARGLNINMTLIFSRSTLRLIDETYRRGLEKRRGKNLEVGGIRLVASFFLSRIDTAVDPGLPENLRGQSAVAVAKIAYREQCERDRRPLPGNARPMSLLWASTGTKNPAYSDTLYVDSLIGRNTVNTLPEKTLLAFLDHGNAKEESLTQNLEAATATLRAVEQAGIDLEAVAQNLRRAGIRQFRDAFDDMLAILR